MDKLYDKFVVVADAKKEVNDEDLKALIGASVRDVKRNLHLHKLQVLTGKGTVPVATVTLEWEGTCYTETSEGNGPIDASFSAVKKILNKKVKLEEFLIQAIHRGSNDLGKVHVQVEHKGQIFYGFSASTDIITASVEAFLDALSQTV